MSAKYYTKKKLPIFFPEDKVCCKNCPEMSADRVGRPYCRASGRMIFFPLEVDPQCPLEEEGGNHE